MPPQSRNKETQVAASPKVIGAGELERRGERERETCKTRMNLTTTFFRATGIWGVRKRGGGGGGVSRREGPPLLRLPKLSFARGIFCASVRCGFGFLCACLCGFWGTLFLVLWDGKFNALFLVTCPFRSFLFVTSFRGFGFETVKSGFLPVSSRGACVSSLIG